MTITTFDNEPMSAQEYRDALDVFDITQNGAGRFVGVNEHTGRRWAMDGPSPPTAKLFRLMIALGLKPRDVDELIRDHFD